MRLKIPHKILVFTLLTAYHFLPNVLADDGFSIDFTKQKELRALHYQNSRAWGSDSIASSTENAFSVKLKQGSYLVSVELQGTADNSPFYIFSEQRRVMTPLLTIDKTQVQTHRFYVNIKTPELEKSEQDDSDNPRVRIRGEELLSRNWDDKLTLSLSNQFVQFNKVNIQPAALNKIILVGDSTVADQANGDYASWGQFLPAFIDNRIVVNHARSGETLKSFISSLRWDKALSHVQQGDIVLIQFGHNDQKKKWSRTYVAADRAYTEYLRAFIADIQQKDAFPVLVSPVARRIYDEAQALINTHKGYDDAVRNLAKALDVPIIDLTFKTEQLYNDIGFELAPTLFGDGGRDKTHHNHRGAFIIANMVAQELVSIFAQKTGVSASNAQTNMADATTVDWFTQQVWPDMRVLDGTKSEN